MSPISSFDALPIEPALLDAVREMGFTEPTAIQAESIPLLLGDPADFIGLAQTGTGKTAAYGIPLLQQLDLNARATQALVLCPTRELSLQVSEQLQRLAANLPDVRIGVLIGGSNYDQQMSRLRQGLHVVVATPGRLLDHLSNGHLDLSQLAILILDEADQMLEMGFIDAVETILNYTPDSKNVWLFSATMPPEIRRIAAHYLKAPHEVCVGKSNAAADKVEHRYYVAHYSDRNEALMRFIDSEPDFYGLIFTRTRAEAKQFADALIAKGYPAGALHGDLAQEERNRVMKLFRDRSLPIVVATDVAARGIDVNDLSHVVQLGLPDDAETYVHRAGRTARAGRTGTSVVIIGPRDVNRLRDIERRVGCKFQKTDLPSAEQVLRTRLLRYFNRLNTIEVQPEQVDNYLSEALATIADLSREELVRRLCWTELQRLGADYAKGRDLNATGPRERGERSDRPNRRENPREAGRDPRGGFRERDSFSPRESGEDASSRYARFCIDLGQRDELDKVGFLRWVSRMTGLRETHIHRIQMQDHHTYFECFADESGQVLHSLNGATFHNRIVSIRQATKEEGPQWKRTPSSAPRKDGPKRPRSQGRSNYRSDYRGDNRYDSRDGGSRGGARNRSDYNDYNDSW
jgi:ATP-dependent RNA helicase DeaD